MLNVPQKLFHQAVCVELSMNYGFFGHLPFLLFFISSQGTPRNFQQF